MAERSGRSGTGGVIRGRLELQDAEAGALEKLTISTVDPSGKRTPVKVGANGSLELDSKLVGQGHTIELRAADGGETRSYSFDTFADRLTAEKQYILPKSAWGPIFPLFRCVSGHVSVCRPPWLNPIDSVATQLAAQLRSGTVADALGETAAWQIARPYSGVDLVPYPWPWRCDPVCSGKVEVFLRTCCCVLPPRPPIIIDRLCEIINCDPPIKIPHDPGDPPYFERGDRAFAARLATRVTASAGDPAGPAPEDILRLADHLTALRALPEPEQVRYIEANPELLYWGCTCSTQEVATTYLAADGSFDACFLAGYVRPGCTQRVLYKVSQLTPSGWQVVYDGVARNQSFSLDADASVIASWFARGCPPSPQPNPGDPPFVLLEAIGGTYSSTLIHSTGQTGPSSFAGPLAWNDGLAAARPAGPLPITAGPYELAWCQGLQLRLRFSEALKGAPFNATKYRLRIVAVDGNGNPVAGSEQPLVSNVVWNKYAAGPAGLPKVVPVPLVTPDAGVYTIPYFDAQWPWLDGQFHAVFDTTRVANGRYLVLVDVLRDDLTHLRPSDSADPASPGDATEPFRFLRLEAPIVAGEVMSTSPVPHSTLANLFQVNNRSADADITQIEFAGTSSGANCQFLSGRDCDTVALRYTARHVDGFQFYHEIWYKQGLSGPIIPTVPPESPEISAANIVNGLSVARSLASMLRGEPRCSFAANLRIYTRHTAGWGRYTGFDGGDQAAFALETTGPCP